MASLEDRMTSLEATGSLTRRQLTELTALMGTSFLNVHHEFDRLYEQNSAMRAEQSAMNGRLTALETDMAHLKDGMVHVKDDVSAILKLLNDKFRGA